MRGGAFVVPGGCSAALAPVQPAHSDSQPAAPSRMTPIAPSASVLAPMYRHGPGPTASSPLPGRPLASPVVAASLTVVSVLWVAGGGLTDLTIATGPALTSLGRLTGLVSADLLLLQVLAMARIPCRRARPRARTGWPAGTGCSASPRSRCCSGTSRWSPSATRPTTRTGVLGRALGPGVDLPGDAAGDRRHRGAGHGGRHLGPGRPPPAALRVVAPAAPVRLPRRRAGTPAPALDRLRLRRLAGRPRVLVDALPRRPGRRPHLPGWRCPRTATCGTGWSCARSSTRPPASCPCTWAAATSTGCRRARRPVLRLALPRRAGLEPRPPLLAVRAGRTGDLLRITVKDLGDGSRRAGRRPPGDPGAGRGAVRRAHRRPPDPPAGHPDRRRHRHHAAARPAEELTCRPAT